MKATNRDRSNLSETRRRLMEALLEEEGVEAVQSPILRRSHSELSPLSFNQEGLWFIEQSEPDKAVYNIPGTVRVTGDLDATALQRSFRDILARHDTLRTACVLQGDELVQRVMETGDFELPVVDLSALAEMEREAEALVRTNALIRERFDLEKGPLFRALLIRLRSDEHILAFAIHHLACDGWSMGVFTRELGVLYSAYADGRSPALPELPVQYADYAAWEREGAKDGAFAEQLAYWKGALHGASNGVRVPTDRTLQGARSYEGRHSPVRIGKALSGRLKELSKRNTTTLFHTLLAAFKVLLHHYTGQTDLVVGTTFANRSRAELEDLIGYFVNSLPIRTDLSGDPSFHEIQERVRYSVVAADAHQQLPFAKLVKDLKPSREPGVHPYFQVLFYYMTLEHNPAVYGFGISPTPDKLDLHGLTLTPLDIDCGLARFDMAVLIWDLPTGLHGTVEYSVDLYDEETIQRMLDLFLEVLETVSERPAITLSEVCRVLQKKEEISRNRSQERAQSAADRRELKGLAGHRRSIPIDRRSSPRD